MTKQHKAELRNYNRAMLWQWDRLRALTPSEPEPKQCPECGSEKCPLAHDEQSQCWDYDED